MDKDTIRYLVIENCVTVISTAALISVIYMASRSFHCFWGLALLVNINSWKVKKGDS